MRKAEIEEPLPSAITPTRQPASSRYTRYKDPLQTEAEGKNSPGRGQNPAGAEQPDTPLTPGDRPHLRRLPPRAPPDPAGARPPPPLVSRGRVQTEGRGSPCRHAPLRAVRSVAAQSARTPPLTPPHTPQPPQNGGEFSGEAGVSFHLDTRIKAMPCHSLSPVAQLNTKDSQQLVVTKAFLSQPVGLMST